MSKRFREAMAVLVALLVATGVAFAAASYPTSVKSFPTRVTGDVISATFFNDPQDEITAIEQGLLNGIAHALNPSAANLRDLGTSALTWRNFFLNGSATWTGNTHLFRSLTGTVNILTVVQGDNAGAVTPTAAALIGQAWLAPTDNNSFDATQGTAYALAGNRGFIQGVHGVASSTTTPASTWGTTGTAAYGFIGVLGEAIGSRAGARIWGGNFLARSETVGIDDVSGIEIDLDTRTAIGNRYGLSIVANATGTVQATSEDMMIRLVNKTGGAQWKDGIVFHSGAGFTFPVATTGTLIRSTGAVTVATGIDFSSLTITGNALVLPGSVSISGAGNIVLGPTPSTSGRLRLAAADEIRFRNTANSADVPALGQTTNRVVLSPSGNDIQWGVALVALGGGAAPTFGTIGGTGPATAAQNTWMRIVDSTGVVFWVPAWK